MVRKLSLLISINVALISISYAQKVNYYPTDTFHVNKGYTVGHRVLVNTVIHEGGNISHVALFPWGDSSKSIYICLTQPVETPWLMYSRMNAPAEESYLDTLRQSRSFFHNFSSEYISFFIKDSINDSVMVVWSGGRFLAKIANIGLGDTPYNYASYCILEPIEKVDNPPSLYDILLIFRKGHFYNGPIYGYNKIELKGKEYSGLIDQAKIMFNNLWYEKKNDYVQSDTDKCNLEINAYAIIKETLPDSIFMFMNCNLMNIEGGGDFASLLLANKDGRKWNVEHVFETDHRSSQFGFGLDIDNNKIPEYIYSVEELDACMGSIFTKLNGKWIEEYIGCL